MPAKVKHLFLLTVLLNSFSCTSQVIWHTGNDGNNNERMISGAEQVESYLPLLKNKNVAIAANQTSIIGSRHIVDSLLWLGVHIKKVFAPEHGFRGDAGAGEIVENLIDKKTGLPLISLYGKKKKPDEKDLEDIDVVIFDIQDVGARFYTYISTLQLIMEACADFEKEFIVLDRPNPNGHYVDGPILDTSLSSFVGMNPIPVVHGLTVGEYAKMVKGEKWLRTKKECLMTVIPCKNYSHNSFYVLPVPPSPNLPNMNSVYLYPSLCLFEGTLVSVGRGTEIPFQVIGYPGFTHGNFSFTPKSIPHSAPDPPYKNMECKGIELSEFASTYIKNLRQLYLFWLINMYNSYPEKKKFFNDYFDILAGSSSLRNMIIEGKTEKEIRESWQPQLEKYKLVRKKYLLYKDFE